jgi:hypothetical protein
MRAALERDYFFSSVFHTGAFVPPKSIEAELMQ